MAALIVSVTTLISTALTIRKKADGEYAKSLGDRLRICERDLKECRRECAKLKEENFRLLRKLLDAKPRSPQG